MQRFSAYDEHFGFVWSCLRRLGVAASDLEDATHDVFVVAHRRRDEVARADSARAWLWGAVRRVASNYRRGTFRHRRRLAAVRTVGPAVVLPERDLERADATRLVTRFLDGLAEPQRDVFVLIELQQMTAREVAEVLQINPNTAAARLRAARKAFEQFAARVREENPFDAADALVRTRLRDAPSDEQKARVGSALAATLLPPASPVLGAGTLGAWLKAAAVSVTLAGATLGTIALVRPGSPASDARSHEAETPTPASPAETSAFSTSSRETVAPDVPTRPAEPVITADRGTAHADSRSARAGSSSARPKDAGSIDSSTVPPATTGAPEDLAAHNAWLARARTALARGDHDAAARIGAEYRETHPTGPFLAELRLVEIRARCGAGEVEEARALARSLAADHPGSPHATLAERSCAGSATKSDARGD